ncbi:MAG: ABC transporter ATP-binding protein [Ignavibacteriae bacterium]|nr:ABC transporter ATP-binding protein [Ignavibacteriota bacterium]NOG97481.1 ABC transporter ATP-binding protein [Ignavibacteriota bacterium]
MLKAENISKSFKKNKADTLHILKDVSLTIEAKKITMIVGASGAGKSTLLHILSGLDKPDTGNVFIKDTNIFQLNDEKLSKFRNQNIGFIFQFHHLLPEFTALENVAIAKMINGLSLSMASEKSKELLEAVGLADRMEHKPAELSGGEQQRVAVARALANNPDIIFADEPTGNLDSVNSNMIHELFIDLQKKFDLTFLIVTHNKELVALGDFVLEMKDGQIFNK